MDRRADRPPPSAPRPISSGEPSLTSGSSSGSSSSGSSSSGSDILRHFHASVFRSHRPVGDMQGSFPGARRVLVPKADRVEDRMLLRSNLGKTTVPADGVVEGSERPPEGEFERNKDGGAAMPRNNPSDDSVITSSSINPKKAPAFDVPKDNHSTFTREGAISELSALSGQAGHVFGNVEIRNSVTTGAASLIDTKNKTRDNSLFLAQTALSSSSAVAPVIPDHSRLVVGGTPLKESDAFQDGIVKGKDLSSSAKDHQYEARPVMNKDSQTSQPSEGEKVSRKKKYDPNVFFKVNGKLYQKLGKIGSGGSSEVHKVISSDCTIYALKLIKLKGRDYPTAYGFCQEIEYLNKLKGKSHIIQLIDYEVTDKTLLQQVVNGSMAMKDGRIRKDEFIYMVLEYGEIDLAHMLAHKWRDMNDSSYDLDENWLRFYWQQMLEAVNTIHEERIVHSDLKPANFLLVRGSLKLIDFGIAKAILNDTTNIQRDAQVGTLNYMSPEAFMWNEEDARGNNTIKCGRPSDIWSLGCILYQMVYGKTPFAEYKTFWAKYKAITDKNHAIAYEPVVSSDPWLVDLMRKCLAWDRDERWRIPQLLRHPFLLPRMPPPTPPSEPEPTHGGGYQCHPYVALMRGAEAFWASPEVARLCSELREVLQRLEREEGLGR